MWAIKPTVAVGQLAGGLLGKDTCCVTSANSGSYML